MRVSVIGCGYLGAVHAACMAENGHEVVGVDVDPARIERLAAGRAPFVEPGLPELLATHVGSGRLRFTTRMEDAADAEVHFLGVGTPQRADGAAADLSYLEAAVRSLIDAVAERPGTRPLVVGKSTVPVGTARQVGERLRARGMTLLWNPEFLREGRAVQDTLAPDRLVYGVLEPGQQDEAVAILDAVYARQLADGTPRIVTGAETSELVKVAANSFLATKISFINAMAELCDRTGADVTVLADAIGIDERIGRKFLHAGIGFGGGCLPKDIRAFMARAGELGASDSLSFLREIDLINARARQHAADRVSRALEGVLTGRTIAVLGAAFKPLSDDIRDSPALAVANKLALRGATVRVTDPAAMDHVRREFPVLRAVDDVEEAVRGADLVFLGTEWPQFVQLDPVATRELVAQPIVVDGRNALDPRTWRDAGWEYIGTGRP
ncbi:UDP-glucose/GDP-mannose dehydrogenase family protein [Brachybacterium sp. EF45031]|uniref:UDP-glucose dehydrogenase family protein n=1 Tax=Brachybacterium sillae TaxID=2810536 RepID=UPI00217D4283|nr:UDP-glucose/GDP-mannose dehydrogenase family protein [Brachybacterium sillae]MCS6711275.1 UDP-glucose/GDP-mannose dehydrogenase family protein [Brachybacterium sillae]